MTTRKFPFISLILFTLLFAGMALAQTDPGVRRGEAGAGGALPSVAANSPAGSLAFFNDALATFKEVDSVSGTIESGVGLGPRFNSRSCASCHANHLTFVEGKRHAVQSNVVRRRLGHRERADGEDLRGRLHR